MNLKKTVAVHYKYNHLGVSEGCDNNISNLWIRPTICKNVEKFKTILASHKKCVWRLTATTHVWLEVRSWCCWCSTVVLNSKITKRLKMNILYLAIMYTCFVKSKLQTALILVMIMNLLVWILHFLLYYFPIYRASCTTWFYIIINNIGSFLVYISDQKKILSHVYLSGR